MTSPKAALLVSSMLLGVLALLPAGCSRPENVSAKPSRGVILFIGDGMGIATVTAARVHKGFQEGKTPPASGVLVVDGAERGGTVRTYASDCMVTDSAAGATALASGHKTVNGALGVSPRSGGGVDTLTSLLEVAESRGLATGLVTTTTITHATPAAFYTHTLERGKEIDIALDVIPGPRNPRIGDGVEVLLGGGRDFWIPQGLGTGKREDGRNLIEEMVQAGYVPVDSAAQLEQAVTAERTKILGLFSSSHLEYEADRPYRGRHQPRLSEMTRAAIQVLSRNKRGWFLMVEGGRIDHALHFNNAYRAVTDMLEFDRAIGEALKIVGPETLVIVTADHDHTMVLSGEPAPDADVFSQAGKDMNGKPFTTLIFGNGPTAALAIPDTLTPDTLNAPDFKERAGIPMPYEEHGGQDVPLYAFGPEKYLKLIKGSMDNTEIYGVLRAAIEGK